MYWSVPIGFDLSFRPVLTVLSRKDKTMKVEYKFADGTVSEVEVPEEIGAYIMGSSAASGLKMMPINQKSATQLSITGLTTASVTARQVQIISDW